MSQTTTAGDMGETEGPKTTLETLVAYIDKFLEATVEERKTAEQCRDYYDGHQWTNREIEELNERNQPVLTFNRIKRKVNTLLGDEVANRRAPQALPRTMEHEEDAQAITDALRYICDEERYDKAKSVVAEESIIEGVGGLLIWPTMADGRPLTQIGPDAEIKIEVRLLHYDRLVRDQHSREPDYSDSRFVGFSAWRTFNDIRGSYDNADEVIEAEGAQYSTDTGDHDGDTLDDRPKHWFSAKQKRMRVNELYWPERDEKTGKIQWWGAHFCRSKFFIEPFKLPFLTDKGESYCPLLLASAYVDRDNRRSGVVKDLLSPQDEINKRRSMALRASLGRQMIVEEGVLPTGGESEAKTELSKPDGVLRVGRDALSQRRLEFPQMTGFDQTQFALYQDAKQEFDGIASDAGPTGANSEANSGREFLARQAVAQKEYGRLWDNLADFDLRAYRVMYYMVRQFWTAPKWLRVRDSEGAKGYKFVQLNGQMSRAERFKKIVEKTDDQEGALRSVLGADFEIATQEAKKALQAMAQQVGQPPKPGAEIELILQSPLMQQPVNVNNVAQVGVDIVIDTAPENGVIQQEEFRDLISLKASGNTAVTDEDIIEASSLRNKAKILARLRQGPSPEQQQLQQQQQQLEMQAIQSQTAVMLAEAEKSKAQAQKSQAEAAKAAAEIQSEQAKVREIMAKAEEHLAEAERERAHAQKLSVEAEQIASGGALGPGAI